MSLESQKVFSTRNPDKGRNIVPVRSNDIARYSEDEAKAVRVKEIWMASAMADLAKSEGHRRTNFDKSAPRAQKIFDVIAKEGPISKVGISNLTGIKEKSVIEVLRNLRTNGSIKSDGKSNTPSYTVLNPEAEIKKPHRNETAQNRREKIFNVVSGSVTTADVASLTGISASVVSSDLSILAMSGRLSKTKRGNVNVFSKPEKPND